MKRTVTNHRLNMGFESASSSSMAFRDIIQPANTATSKPPKGNMMLAVKKSSRSKMVLPSSMPIHPSGAKPDHRFRERIDAIPRAQHTKPAPKVLVMRVMPFCSSNHSTMGSSRDMPEVQAAKINSMKNKVPNRLPIGT